MRKWKWSLLCAALAAAAAVSGCSSAGRQNSVPANVPGAETVEQEETETVDKGADDSEASVTSRDVFTIGYAAGGVSAWHKANIQNYQDVFREENGYQLTVADCGNDSMLQLETVRGWIAQQLDYIVAAPIVPEGWEEVLKEAQHTGVPVILVEHETDADASLYDAWIGNDTESEGIAVGNWLAGYSNGREMDIVVIENASMPAGFMQGFRQILSQHEEWKIVQSLTGDATREGGRKAMEDLIRLSHGKFQTVICQNDEEAFGAMDAMDAAGITYGVDGDVIMIAFGTEAAGMQQTMDGKIHCGTEYTPFQANAVEEVIRGLMKGESYEEPVLINNRVFTAPGVGNEYAEAITEAIWEETGYDEQNK